MSTNRRTMAATPETVWEVLADGWLYPLWVVGASRMRKVDAGWPSVGARLHHSVGSWPLLLDDTTEVLKCEEWELLQLKARSWPFGVAHVTIRIEAREGGCDVVMEEQAVSGPGAVVPQPMQDPLLAWRNVEALRRLAYLVERRP